MKHHDLINLLQWNDNVEIQDLTILGMLSGKIPFEFQVQKELNTKINN
jgi:hypothetical protein